MSYTQQEKEVLRELKHRKLMAEIQNKDQIKSKSKPNTDHPTFSSNFLDKFDWSDAMERTADTAKVGESYVVTKRIHKTLERFDNFGMQLEDEEIDLEEYTLWTVTQPTTSFVKYNHGYVPKILVDGKWLVATPTQCLDWANIPTEQKRVDYLLGKLPTLME